MWARFMRVIRSFLGLFIRNMENPQLLLQQAMDELKTEIPKMNKQAADIVAHQKTLEIKAERAANKVAELEGKVEMAVKGGDKTKNAALVLIQSLESEMVKLEDLKEGIVLAQNNTEKILKMRTAFEQKVKKQIEECRTQLSRHEMAAAEERMANLMGNFEVGDISDTLDNVTDKIDERLARARGKILGGKWYIRSTCPSLLSGLCQRQDNKPVACQMFEVGGEGCNAVRKIFPR